MCPEEVQGGWVCVRVRVRVRVCVCVCVCEMLRRGGWGRMEEAWVDFLKPNQPILQAFLSSYHIPSCQDRSEILEGSSTGLEIPAHWGRKLQADYFLDFHGWPWTRRCSVLLSYLKWEPQYYLHFGELL